MQAQFLIEQALLPQVQIQSADDVRGWPTEETFALGYSRSPSLPRRVEVVCGSVKKDAKPILVG